MTKTFNFQMEVLQSTSDSIDAESWEEASKKIVERYAHDDWPRMYHAWIRLRRMDDQWDPISDWQQHD